MNSYSVDSQWLQQICRENQAKNGEIAAMQSRLRDAIGRLNGQVELARRLEAEGRLANAETVRDQIARMQQEAIIMRETLNQRRLTNLEHTKQAIQVIARLYDTVAIRLLSWRRQQKLSQIGAPFEAPGAELDRIQAEFDFLGRSIHGLLEPVLEQLKTPEICEINNQYAGALNNLKNELDGMFRFLIANSLIVTEQPEQVVKVGNRLTVELRFLTGNIPFIKQQLSDAEVKVQIITAEEAQQVINNVQRPNCCKSVGHIEHDISTFSNPSQCENMIVNFDKAKLTKIDNRRCVGCRSRSNSKNGDSLLVTTTVNQLYCLLFSFNIDDNKINVFTVSLPFTATVHGSQNSDAQAVIFWQRAFTDIDCLGIGEPTWDVLKQCLRWKFAQATSSNRLLSDENLTYLAAKLNVRHADERITLQRFHKETPKDSVHPFWKWFHAIMSLVRNEAFDFWDQGWLIGFISKNDASISVENCQNPCYLLRFSDSMLGAVSLVFAKGDRGKFVALHLEPFDSQKLDEIALHQRIATCDRLQHIRHFYPDIESSAMFRHFDKMIGKKKAEKKSPLQGYVKTTSRMDIQFEISAGTSAFSFEASPSPLENETEFDRWKKASGNHRVDNWRQQESMESEEMPQMEIEQWFTEMSKEEIDRLLEIQENGTTYSDNEDS